MDSLGTNKIAGAVFLAGIVFVGAGQLSNALVKPKVYAGIAIKIDSLEATKSVAAVPQADPPVALLLASADVGRGEGLMKSQGCVACHSLNEGGKNGVGPNLYGVVAAKQAAHPGYEYSKALSAKGGQWTYDELNSWLKKPASYAPGTRMSYAGLADPVKRADIIDYLRTLATNPEALPAVPAGAIAAAAAPVRLAAASVPALPAGGAPEGVQPIAARLASASVDAGKASSLKLGCIACHQFQEGGKNGVGPALYGVVGAQIGGHVENYNYSTALKGKSGEKWTYEELDKWLTKPATYAPGTRMSYAGVTDPAVRANVIDYLRSLAANPEPLPTN